MVIGLLGFGTVGGGVYEMLRDRMCMDVKYVLCLENPEGLAGKLVRSVDQILSDDTVDTVVEVMGGLHPAREFVLQAMAAGKNVFTANKLLLAECYEELTKAAAQNHVALRCTAAVGGGIGWLTALERCKRTERVHELTGIMNGTTNYILDTMQTRGVSFADALHQAQELGYAERDPAADIDGEDILNKLVVSANVAFDALLQKADVPVFGIRSVQLADMQTFRERGWCCRLIASAEHYGEGVCAVIEPTLVRATDMEAAVHSNFNLISFISPNAGKQSFYGQGAGRFPTAYNVVQDLLDVAAGKKAFYAPLGARLPVDNDSFVRQYYVRTTLDDPFLSANVAEIWPTGIVTAPLSAKRMHAWADDALERDPGLFFAALR